MVSRIKSDMVWQIKLDMVSKIKSDTVIQIKSDTASQINSEMMASSELTMPMTALASDTWRENGRALDAAWV